MNISDEDTKTQSLVFGVEQKFREVLFLTPSKVTHLTFLPDMIVTPRLKPTCRKGGMILSETLIELNVLHSSCSSLSSYWNWTNDSLSSNSSQRHLSQQYPPPLLTSKPGHDRKPSYMYTYIYIYIYIYMWYRYVYTYIYIYIYTHIIYIYIYTYTYIYIYIYMLWCYIGSIV